MSLLFDGACGRVRAVNQHEHGRKLYLRRWQGRRKGRTHTWLAPRISVRRSRAAREDPEWEGSSCESAWTRAMMGEAGMRVGVTPVEPVPPSSEKLGGRRVVSFRVAIKLAPLSGSPYSSRGRLYIVLSRWQGYVQLGCVCFPCLLNGPSQPYATALARHE